MRDIGPAELLLILAVCILLFGAKKLPDVARGAGQAVRIFRTETRGLVDEDRDHTPVDSHRAGQSPVHGGS